MLLKDFYTITDITNSTNSYCVRVKLNADHEIYKGHFPEQPIVPGVCIIQLVKECIEKINNVALCYNQIQTCKFLAVIDPKTDNIIEITISLENGENNSLHLQADILQKGKHAAKLKGILSAIKYD